MWRFRLGCGHKTGNFSRIHERTHDGDAEREQDTDRTPPKRYESHACRRRDWLDHCRAPLVQDAHGLDDLAWRNGAHLDTANDDVVERHHTGQTSAAVEDRQPPHPPTAHRAQRRGRVIVFPRRDRVPRHDLVNGDRAGLRLLAPIARQISRGDR